MSAKKRGRKPVEDPKQTVNLFVRKSAIELLGGYDQFRDNLNDYVTKLLSTYEKSYPNRS